MHFDPAVPGDLRDWIRELLEPRLVGAAPVVKSGVRKDDDFLLLVGRGGRRRKTEFRNVGKTHGPRRHVGVDPALRQRIDPVLVEAGRVPGAPLGLQIIEERPSLPGKLEDHVASRLRSKHRLHHRLLQPDDAGPRPAVAPLLERMVIGQNQVAGGRRLVHVGREADLVPDFAERLLERTRERVRRVRGVHEEERNATVCHVRREFRQLAERVRRTEREIGAELHERADRSDHVVQDIHRGDDFRTIRALRGHPAGHGESAARPGKLSCEPDDRRFVDPDHLSDGARAMCPQHAYKPAGISR